LPVVKEVKVQETEEGLNSYQFLNNIYENILKPKSTETATPTPPNDATKEPEETVIV